VFQAKSSQVSVRIAHWLLPSLEARDVRSVLKYENGTFNIQELNLATTDGLRVKADGRITDFSQKPNGALNLSINAPNAAAVSSLSRMAGFATIGSAARRRIDALAPLELKGNLKASRKTRILKLTLAGSAAGSELLINGQLDGDFVDLNTSKLKLNGSISNADGRRLIAQLAPEAALNTSQAKAGPGTLKITASGALKSGLKGQVVLRTPEAQGRMKGQIMPLDTPWSLDGDLSLRASKAATALSLLRISPGGTPVSGALDMRATVVKKASRLEIGSLDLRIGGESIGGNVTVDMSGSRPKAKIKIGAETVVLPRIASYLVDWDRKDLSSQIAEATSGPSLWPNRAFSFHAFEAADGTLSINASKLLLSDGITLREGKFQASLKNGVLNVTALKGQLYGGKFSATGKLTSARGRIALDAQLELNKANLARIAQNSTHKPLVKSRGALELSFKGEGFSPRGLVSALSGSGTLKIKKGVLNNLSPKALGNAVNTYLSEEIPQKDKFVSYIKKELWKGNVRFKGLTIPVAIKDGMLKFKKAMLSGRNYRVSVSLLMDLAALRLDSDWKLFYMGATKFGEKLPPFRFVFAGPLSNLGKIRPQIEQAQFERLLSMRRMEKDLNRLEELGQGRNTSPKKRRASPKHPARSSRTPQEPSGWSTAIETRPKEKKRNIRDFETRIRRTLESKQNP
jgi:uncharacterized protein involved in outer membrane biogenesis